MRMNAKKSLRSLRVWIAGELINGVYKQTPGWYAEDFEALGMG
jgi:hypothetical protein